MVDRLEHTCSMAAAQFVTGVVGLEFVDPETMKEQRVTTGRVRAPKAGPCKACEALTEAWLEQHDPDHVRDRSAVTADRVRDVLHLGNGKRVTLDVLSDLDLLAMGPEEIPETTGDPQHRWDTDRDAARAALRAMRRNGAVRAVLAQIARNAPSGEGAVMRDRVTLTDKRDAAAVKRIMRTWAVPSRVRADMKATDRAIGVDSDALAVAMRDAAEANRPDAQRGSHRWAVPARPDRRTWAGPLVIRDREGRTKVVQVKQARDGSVTHKRVPLLPSSALESRGYALYRTGWRPDAATIEGDRFTARQEPLPPVRRPSSRKRKRDGAIGGPASIEHR